MAKKKKNNDPVVLDGMPGADPIAAEEKEPFQVDLNFETEEEVEFPKEGEVEEIEESELTTTPEELEQKAEEEVEAEGDTTGEDTSEETVDAVDDEATQPAVQPAPEPVAQEEVVEEVVEEVKKPMVPKSRLDEVLAKQKALQKKLNEMEVAQQQAEEAPTYDFTAKENEYQQLVLDGEAEKAVALRNEIRNAEKDQFMFEVQQKMGQTVQQSTEAVALQAKADALEAEYPVFDVNSADHNPEILKEALDLRDAFMVQGYEGADALEKAVNLTVLQHPEVVATPEPAPTPAPEVKKVEETQKKANVTKKIEAAESQPPQMGGQSDAKKQKNVDINTLSEKEFAALPAETLRRLRGDFG